MIDTARRFSLFAETPPLRPLFFNVLGTALGARYRLEPARRRAATANAAHRMVCGQHQPDTARVAQDRRTDLERSHADGAGRDPLEFGAHESKRTQPLHQRVGERSQLPIKRRRNH